MSRNNEKQFLKKLMTDAALRAKVEEASSEDITAIAREAGFDIDPVALEKAARELRSASAPKVTEISPEEMDKAAAGVLWLGEDAPDGHEMGCAFVYHLAKWSVQNDIWCKSVWYCLSEHHSLEDSPVPS